MLVIFTDLDGTLLDTVTYSFESARPALEVLRQSNIPLVFCTSKTRAEVLYWRRLLDNNHPFIVENGGALLVPQGYFPTGLRAPKKSDGFLIFEFGGSYMGLVRILREAAAESGCSVRGFHEMDVHEVSRRCDMPLEVAALAKQREYDEPFEVLGPGEEALTQAIEKRGKRWTRGGRFYHILGNNDKAHCVCLLTHFYGRFFGAVQVAGIGDGLNDAGFLRAVDFPLILKSRDLRALRMMVPRSRVVGGCGPDGWSCAVLDLLANTPMASVSPIQARESMHSRTG